MPPPDPLALVIWVQGLEMGTVAIVSVTEGTTESGATTVIAIGIGDTVIVGSEFCVEMTALSTLLLTLSLIASERRRSRSPDRRRY